MRYAELGGTMANIERFQEISVGNYISIFYRIGVSYLSKRYEKYNIGFGQYQFLITLYFEDGLSQDELTKRVCVDKGTTARAINKLKELGYVTVKVDSIDKRIHRVMLTDKALSIQDDVLGIVEEWENMLLNSLTEEDKQTIQGMFKKVAIANGWLNS